MYGRGVAVRGLDGLGDEIVSCRRCPRLVAWREAVARRAAGLFRRAGVLGPPTARFR